MALTVAVAMATYNGASFVEEQLRSIALQTLLPVELVVCDDCSSDDTVDRIRQFALTASFPVRLTVNDGNLGVARNFGKAIGLCDADCIAIADQDDFWKPEKLATIVAAFENDPDLALVFTDGDNVDEQLRPMGDRLSDSGHIGVREQATINGPDAFSFLLRRNVATGATMAFRSDVRDLVLPIPDGIATYHDAWIVQLVAAAHKVAFLRDALILYRRHGAQQTWDFVTGARKTLGAEHYTAQLRQLTAMRERLASKAHHVDPALALLDGYIRHLTIRSGLPSSLPSRLAAVMSELTSGRYHRYSSGVRSAARDLIRKIAPLP